jgi:hypothetical protein
MALTAPETQFLTLGFDMPAYTTIPNALVAVGAKPFATTVQAFRDNPLAIAEGDPTAPVNAFAWHPFDKVTNGDANTGRIWSFAVNGAVAAVTSPDFVDGWDYGFWFERVGGSSGSVTNFNANLWRETTGAYAGVGQIGSVAGTLVYTGFLEIAGTRLVRTAHAITGPVVSLGAANAVQAQGVSGSVAVHATAQKILRCQFTCTAGNITGTGAAIYMLRRRNVAT